MHRGLCSVWIAALLLCGCAKKDPPHEAETAEGQAVSTAPAESNAPALPTKIEHPVVATVREFIDAVAAGNYGRALALSVPSDPPEITQQGLDGIRVTFQLDQTRFTQAWLGAEQAAVITNFIPAKQGSATVAWAFNLLPAQDGRWLVRLYDMLANPQMLEDYLAAFHEVAPGAQAIELSD